MGRRLVAAPDLANWRGTTRRGLSHTCDLFAIRLPQRSAMFGGVLECAARVRNR